MKLSFWIEKVKKKGIGSLSKLLSSTPTGVADQIENDILQRKQNN